MPPKTSIASTSSGRLRQKNAFDAHLVIGARKFNRATGRRDHFKHLDIKGRMFIDPRTQHLKKHLSVFRPCPLCGGHGNSDALFVKMGFTHVRCRRCAMIYVDRTLREERLHTFYTDEASYTRILLNKQQQRLDRMRFAYALRHMELHLKTKGKLLDIGCGPGVFLQTARGRGWTVQGLEFNKWCVRTLKKNKVDVIEHPLDKARLPSHHYLCVSLWDVLEHIANPRTLLAQIRRILKPEGILLIEVPNIDALVTRLLHDRSKTFAGDSHINFFNVRSLSQLLKRCGFAVVEAETILTELGTIHNHMNYEDPYFGEAAPILDFLTPQYLHDNLLGSRILLMARPMNKSRRSKT